MSLWKKILFIGLFLTVAVGFGFLIYRMFFAGGGTNVNNANGNVNGLFPNINNANRPPVNAITNTNGALPNVNISGYQAASEIASGGATAVKPLVDGRVEDMTLAGNQKDVLYYDKATGELKKVLSDGSAESLLTQEKFPEATCVSWSPTRDKVALCFPDDAKIVYDLAKSKQYSLPQETTGFSFSPNGTQLAYKYQGTDASDQWLAVSNPDGSGATVVEKLGDNAQYVTVNWSPNNQIIATYAKTTSSGKQEIVFLGQNNENFPSVEVQGQGFKSKWSQTGEKILYSVSSTETGYAPSLWIMDGKIDNLGQHQQEINLATWPDKCAFGVSNTIYCAVPRFTPQYSDVYPELAEGVPDDFYRIDLTTGVSTLIAQPVNASGYGNFTAENVQVSSNEDMIYFTDEATGRIYEIRLK